MSTLKEIMKEKLEKGKVQIKEDSRPKVPGKLQEFFDETLDKPITDEELLEVMNDNIPYLDKKNSNYHEKITKLARIKRNNPDLYNKMKNWD